MFRPKEAEDVKPDFGKFAEEIDELLYYLARVPHAMYAVLGFFVQYKMSNKDIINEYIKDDEDKIGENSKMV